jgi:hypothetical protein
MKNTSDCKGNALADSQCSFNRSFTRLTVNFSAGRVDLLVKKLDNTIVMLVVAARVEEVLPSISKSSCSKDKGGGLIC